MPLTGALESLGLRATRDQLEATLIECERRFKSLATLDPAIVKMANGYQGDKREEFLAEREQVRLDDRARVARKMFATRTALMRRGITPRN